MNRQCEKYFDLIEDFIEGELDGQIAGRVNSHVSACPPCLEEYETLRREKEIYAQYLFAAEPPPDLWRNLQTRLVSEKENTASRARAFSPVNSLRRSLGIFGFLRLSPTATAAAVLLLGLGTFFIWSKLAPIGQSSDKNLAETLLRDSQTPPKFNETATADLTTETIDEIDNAPNAVEARDKNQPFEMKPKLPRVKEKLTAFEPAKIKQKSASPGERKIPQNISNVDEENRPAALKLKKLETEIAGQIEKTELLLRSFRNARELAGIGTFDVEYERLQARKLLDENRRLRRDAENYGIVYAEELLGRAEPYLLDIANLEANPAPGKVLDIKERVNRQNIIASLQVYNSAAIAATAAAQ